jgi:hypothetical protein
LVRRIFRYVGFDKPWDQRVITPPSTATRATLPLTNSFDNDTSRRALLRIVSMHDCIDEEFAGGA